jgi:hypothetical protein
VSPCTTHTIGLPGGGVALLRISIVPVASAAAWPDWKVACAASTSMLREASLPEENGGPQRGSCS